MRSTHTEKPCAFCTQPTRFLLQLLGPRCAPLKWVPACPDCGENPDKRKEAA